MAADSVEGTGVSNTDPIVLVLTGIELVELLKVGVALTDASVLLDAASVSAVVGCVVTIFVVLVAEVVVIGSVVVGTEVVGPAAVAIILVVLVAVRVVTSLVAEGVAAHAELVADLTRSVPVTLIAQTSLLLAIVVVVVAGDGVEGHVDLARVVAPLVVDGLLGIVMVVDTPLVPGVVRPLVVTLTLMTALTVRVMAIGGIVTLSSILVTVILVVDTVGFRAGVTVATVATVAAGVLVILAKGRFFFFIIVAFAR